MIRKRALKRKVGNRSGSRWDSEDNPRKQGEWEIVYTGFVLILLSFFIMLCSFSTIQGSRITRFVRSFNQAINILQGGVRTEPGDIILFESGEMVDRHSDLAKLYSDIHELTGKLGLLKEIRFRIMSEGLSMRLPDIALFPMGAADISEASKPLLSKIAHVIRQTSYPVRIEGHTDDIPIHTPDYPSNWELSTSRAVNVLRYFVKTEHIPPDQLSAVGFSQYHPIVSNDSEENRAKNRRVEIIFIRKHIEINRKSRSTGGRGI